MAAVTVLSDDVNSLPNCEILRVTTTGTTSTYQTKKFAEIVAAVGQNESDTDGVGIAVSGQTVTITVGTSGDVVALWIVGRK